MMPVRFSAMWIIVPRPGTQAHPSREAALDQPIEFLWFPNSVWEPSWRNSVARRPFTPASAKRSFANSVPKQSLGTRKNPGADAPRSERFFRSLRNGICRVDTGELLTRWTVRLALALYALG